jgi:hypothetical protein
MKTKTILIIVIVIAIILKTVALSYLLMQYLIEESQIDDNDCGCTNADRAFLKTVQHQFRLDVKSSGVKSFGNGQKASQNLHELYPTLSQSCANCFGQFVNCSRQNCEWTCIQESHGSKCDDCCKTHCADELAKCTKLNVADITSTSS